MGQGRGAVGETADPQSKLMVDTMAFAMNVSTSVLIVFVNKLLMDPKRGYGFVFATTLCSLHFFSAGGFVKLCEALGYGTFARLPFTDTLYFATVAAVSIASLNLSLLVNSVGFYQISKLLIIPFVCLVEFIWFGKRFTGPVITSVVIVVAGVSVVTVSEISVNPLGLIIAAVSVVTSGMQQILCGVIQRKHTMTSNQLLSNTAPLQGLMLLVVGPFIDQALTDKWVLNYRMTQLAAAVLTASCAIAVLVNISQFMCLGRFSAVTFQVLGHTKTMLVLIIGWLYFGDVITQRKLLGMILAVVGMVMYGYLSSLKGPGPALQKKLSAAEYSPLLGNGSREGKGIEADAEAGGVDVVKGGRPESAGGRGL